MIREAVARALHRDGRYVVAVSGGIDSMVLLEAIASMPARPFVVVSSFDHATGPHSLRATRVVRRRARTLGIECVVGRSHGNSTRESEWRDERWNFLRAAAASIGGIVVTAHTRDDQIETVFMRILREAGPRGLAGLYAESDIVRPFVDVSRSEVAAFALANRVKYVDDPSNLSRAHLRNRVRLDLLPAINRVQAGFSSELLALSRRASEWRCVVARAVDGMNLDTNADGSVRIARSALAGYDADALRMLWPALAATANIVMDRRGTHRLAEFTMKGRTGASIQLSGGVEVRMLRDHLLLGKWDFGRVQQARRARLGSDAHRGIVARNA
ncbi:MAG: tRNA lysidine(34) synthetase TilS [Gemmatimonadota bacterium]|nr:tRNA lysidine(34) synthetase TilS [Gemmatimonadota bacterium]